MCFSPFKRNSVKSSAHPKFEKFPDDFLWVNCHLGWKLWTSQRKHWRRLSGKKNTLYIWNSWRPGTYKPTICTGRITQKGKEITELQLPSFWFLCDPKCVEQTKKWPALLRKFFQCVTCKLQLRYIPIFPTKLKIMNQVDRVNFNLRTCQKKVRWEWRSHLRWPSM